MTRVYNNSNADYFEGEEIEISGRQVHVYDLELNETLYDSMTLEV